MQKKLESAAMQARGAHDALLQAQTAVKHLQNEIPAAYHDQQQLQQQLQGLKEQIDRFTSAYEQSSRLLQDKRDQLTVSESELKSLVQRMDTLKVQCLESENNWIEVLKCSEFADETAFHNALLEDKDQTTLAREVQLFFNELSSIKGALGEQEKQLADSSKPDLEQLQASFEDRSAALEAAEQAWHFLDKRYCELLSVKEKLEKAHNTHAKLEAQYKIYGTMSEVANGRTGNKISLQRFV